MSQSLALSTVLVNPFVELVQRPVRRARAKAKLAATTRPIIVIADKPLPLWCDGFLPEPTAQIALEFSNALLRVIPQPVRRQMGAMAERVLDHLTRYLAGQSTTHEFTRGMSAFQSDAIFAHNKLYPTPTPTRSSNPYRDPAIVDRFRMDHNAESASKLCAMLKSFLDINATPTGGFHRDGKMAYRAQHYFAGWSLVIDRRAPDGEGWLTTKTMRIVTRDQAQAALVDLDLEYHWRAGKLIERPRTRITERVDLNSVDELEQRIADRRNGYREQAVSAAIDASRKTQGYSIHVYSQPPAPIVTATNQIAAPVQERLPNV